MDGNPRGTDAESESWAVRLDPRNLPEPGRKAFLRLFALGLALRLLLSPLYGTQDMEWWKAWGTYALRDGVTRIYGASDAEILDLHRAGKGREQIRDSTQKVMSFVPHKYDRTEYRLTQPPVYIYSISAATWAYALIRPDLPNGRLFNAFLNLLPILASALLALFIARFVDSSVAPGFGYLASLLYWLNPVVLLNSPIQGYQDPLCVLFAVVSVAAACRGRVAWACVFLVLGFLTKPQGVLVAPVVLWAGLLKRPLGQNFIGWGMGALAGLVVALPYLITGRMLSVIQGVLSISDSSLDFSRQSMNLWWPVQYIANAFSAVSEGQVGWGRALLGSGYEWFSDRPADILTPYLGFSVRLVGLALLAAFTIFNLHQVWKRHRQEPLIIPLAAAMQVYAYFILRVGVQGNHYFLMVPLFALFSCRSTLLMRAYLAFCLIFLFQDLAFYGFGRDLNPGKSLLSILHLGWFTIIASAANVALFGFLCRQAYRSWEPAPAGTAGPERVRTGGAALP